MDARDCHSAGMRGFTLLEVMIAVAIIAYAFVGLLGLQARNIKAITRDQNMTRATLLARELISQIQYQVTTGAAGDLGNGQGTFDGYPGFSWERQVVPTGIDEVREIIVRVIWDPRSPTTCELVYFIRDPGL